jgi:hypothetical protein
VCLLEIPADAYLDYVVGVSPANRIVVSALVQRVQMVETALLQRDKLSTLGKLAAGLAHDLNNPAAAATRSASQLAGALQGLRRVADLSQAPTPGVGTSALRRPAAYHERSSANPTAGAPERSRRAEVAPGSRGRGRDPGPWRRASSTEG